MIYDIDSKIFYNTNHTRRNSFVPEVNFGMHLIWDLELIREDGSAADLSGITSWRAAIDKDFADDTEPMCRTLTGISVTGNLVSIPINTNTPQYRAKCNGTKNTPATFDLYGLDETQDEIFFTSFGVKCRYPVDANITGLAELEEIPDGMITQTQAEALARRIVAEELANFEADPGEPGDPGPLPQWQFSITAIDGSWHDSYFSGDCYIRLSADKGETWSTAIPFGALATFPVVALYDETKQYPINSIVRYGTPSSVYQSKEAINFGQDPEEYSMKWNCICSGATGAAGATWIYADGEPNPNIGDVDDSYLDQTTYNHYKKTSEGWQQVGNLKGKDGAGIVWRGAWTELAQYAVSDLVQHNGSLWICSAAHHGQEPPESSDGLSICWSLYLAAGSDGAPGIAGTTDITKVTMLSPTEEAEVVECTGSTFARRKYELKIPRGSAGPAGQTRIIMGDVLESGEDPKLEQSESSTPYNRIYVLSIPQGPMGETGNGLAFDYAGTMAERDQYNNSDKGFVFACTDLITDDLGTHQTYYMKRSDDYGDWSDGIILTTGVRGIKGDSIKGDPGPAGDAAYAKEDHVWCLDDLVANCVVVPGLTPLSSVEIFDADEHSRALSWGRSDIAECVITYIPEQNETIVAIASGVDCNYGGRIRFAQSGMLNPALVKGHLQVTLADNIGQWSINDGTTWYDSGSTIDLAAGSYRLSFADVAAHITPEPQAISIEVAQNTNISAMYEPMTVNQMYYGYIPTEIT
ncbi:MAG: hypothetical protein WCS15_07660, partial [Prevotella sp.]